MVKDNQTEQLISKAISLLKDQELIASLSKNAKLGKPNASKDIVKEIKLVKMNGEKPRNPLYWDRRNRNECSSFILFLKRKFQI